MTLSPWFKFYPGDWRSDPALRVCSLAARGLWMEMLCIMHEAIPRGWLRVNDKPVTDRQLAALAGISANDVRKHVVELKLAGVFSQDGDTLFSRRMVRDTEKGERDKANGKAGGNPQVNPKGGVGVNPPVNPPVKAGDKAYILELEARGQKDTPPPAVKKVSPPSVARVPAAPKAPTLAEQAVAAFNAVAKRTGWPVVRHLTADRKSLIRKRLATVDGIAGWQGVLDRAAASPFLCGEGERGWRLDLDFLLKPNNFAKILEGGYDHVAGPNGASGPVSRMLGILGDIARGPAEAAGGWDGEPAASPAAIGGPARGNGATGPHDDPPDFDGGDE